MRNYIKADLFRIIHKKRRWVLIALICILFALLGQKGKDNLYQVVNELVTWLPIAGLLIAVIEISYVYGDDFKARTMQIAIGSGLPRQKVVHAKWLEFMIVAAIDVDLYALFYLLISTVFQGTEGGFDVKTLIVNIFIQWLTMTACIGCVMFIMFLNQGIVLAMLVYILLALGSGIAMFLTKILVALNLSRFHIESYFLSNMLDTLGARLILGHISWFNALGILIYMMIGFALASILFKKKELEF